jgi:hypothetical protein
LQKVVEASMYDSRTTRRDLSSLSPLDGGTVLK